MINAFLLTRQYFDTKAGVQLVFWFSCQDKPRKIIINAQKVLFFIRQVDVKHAYSLLPVDTTVTIKALALKTFNFDAVSAVYFPSQQLMYRTRAVFSKAGIGCFESDIRPPERYLTERFLTGPVTIQSDSVETELVNPKITAGKFQPNLAVMSFDIETDYVTNQLFSIAFVTQTTQRILMLKTGVSSVDEKNKIEYCSSETCLIQRFLELIEKIDPDMFIGWNVVNFDFRFLQKKADDLQIPLTMGRQNSLINWRQQQNNEDRHFLLVPGRVVLDGIDTLKSATYQFPNFSLDAVGHELIERGKLIENNHNDPLFKAKEIQRQFREEPETLAAYNLEDCQLVWDIFQKTDLINFAIERARLTGLEMDRFGGSVAAFDNLYLPRLHRKGYVAPNIGDYEGQLSAPGGYVMESVPGMHQSVLVLDYKSLYPSIIRTFMVDPYARIAAIGKNGDDIIAGYDGATFLRSDAILPDIIKNLWAARDEAKKENNQSLSQAIKIIMNSFYGVLGTPGCRLHDSRLTSSITKRSHDIIIQTVSLIEKSGYTVIYGDTDSVFVALGKQCQKTEADRVGNALISEINRFWRSTLVEEMGIVSYLEMEYETHFIKFFMPTIRGSDKGSKKRYAGMVEDESGHRELIFKGLETVRTDWTDLAKEFQKTLYQRVFNEEEYADYIRAIVVSLRSGKLDSKLVYRKRLRQKLSDYQKNIPPHAQAAIKAEQIFLKKQQGSRYQNAKWIEYVITNSGPETLECRTAPLNYEHYIEKQLVPIGDAIILGMGDSMAAILDNQIEMF